MVLLFFYECVKNSVLQFNLKKIICHFKTASDNHKGKTFKKTTDHRILLTVYKNEKKIRGVKWIETCSAFSYLLLKL